MQPEYVKAATELAQRTPLIFVITLLSALLAGILLAALWSVWKGIPKLLDWVKVLTDTSHARQEKLLTDLRTDADKDIARSERAVTDAHNTIGAKVDAVHKDVLRIAAKIGASTLLLSLAIWGALGIVPAARIMFAAKCVPACPDCYKCRRATPRTCEYDQKSCSDKTAKKPEKKEETATGPRSDNGGVRMAWIAAIGCDPRSCEG